MLVWSRLLLTNDEMRAWHRDSRRSNHRASSRRTRAPSAPLQRRSGAGWDIHRRIPRECSMEVDRRSMFKLAGAGAVVTGLGVAVPATASAATTHASVPTPGATSDATTSGPVAGAPVVLPGSAAAIRKAKALVAQMSLDEKIVFLHG